MKKIYIGVILALIIVAGIFVLNNSDSFDYAVVVDSEVKQLENELATLNQAVEAGTLTEAQATEAKIKILTRLNTINESMVASESGKLTPTQRQQLSDGLDKLKTVLITYQATLTAVDSKAVDAQVKTRIKGKSSSGSYHKNLNLAVANTIEIVQDVTEEVVADYESDIEVDGQVDDIVIEEETTLSEDDEEDDISDEEMDETGTDDGASMDMPTMDESSTTEMEIEAEAEITL